MKEVREKLEKNMQENHAEKIHEETFSLMKKIFGNKSQEALISDLEKQMVKKGKVQERMLTIAQDLSGLKSRAKTKQLTQSEMQRAIRDSADLTSALTEYSQRKDLISAEEGIAQLIFNDGQKAEIVSADNKLFVITKEKIMTLDLKKSKLEDSNRKEFEIALAKTKHKMKFNLPAKALEILKKKLGDFTISF